MTPYSKKQAALGEALFFEPRLSSNGNVSCATCHVPELGFADGEPLSQNGVSGNLLHRHSPTLINLAWADRGLFWDGGSKNLESLVFGPLTHQDEMAQRLDELDHFLLTDPHYRAWFEAAFEAPFEIGQLARALAQYVRSLICADTRYDRAHAEPSLLSAHEQRGLALVRAHCQSCHRGELFTDNGFHNNGLDSDYADTDEGIHLGRYRISFQEEDRGSFKTPTLRHVTETAPYMHDGRFESLREVIEHYRTGVRASPSLAPELRSGISLSDEDVEDLLAFLETLRCESLTAPLSF